MNSKTAKVVRAYVNQIRSEGDPIILKDVKRRMGDLPPKKRGEAVTAMAGYLREIRIYDATAPSSRELRQKGKARATVIEGRRQNPILQMLAAMFGIGAKR